MRKEYLAGKLNEEECPENPYTLFCDWYEQAVLEESFEPNAFALSTVGKDLQPHSRMVLLKSFEENKFIFATNYDSQKGKDLAENSRASFLFYWAALERQVRIEGNILKTSRSESQEIFLNRPKKSQIGALASEQSKQIPNREFLEKKFKSIESSNQNYICPENWGGYYLVPEYYEFWQGRENRLHDRIIYSLKNNWIKTRISP